jgi:twitching motility protein PilI
MAQREALRELQARLAARLQVARTEGVQAAWLALEAGGAGYLFPLSQAGEIFSLVPPQPVPYTQPWFLGVANLRGGLWTVIDLAAFVANAAPAQRTEADREDVRLVTLNALLDVNCALLVDRLAGLRSPDGFGASTPAPMGSPDWFGKRYTDADGRPWQEVDLQALSRHPDFLTVSA